MASAMHLALQQPEHLFRPAAALFSDRQQRICNIQNIQRLPLTFRFMRPLPVFCSGFAPGTGKMPPRLLCHSPAIPTSHSSKDPDEEAENNRKPGEDGNALLKF